MLKKIVITGPESTGKSNLAEALANHYKTAWVPEYARVYLNKLGRDYNYDDLLNITKGQYKLEKEYEKQSNEFLFLDTSFLVMKIWCQYKYNKCHPWIIENLEKQSCDLYLLCDIDLPWQPDPLREHPDKRKFLFDWYQRELSHSGNRFALVSGIDEQRACNAIRIIDDTFK